MRTTKNAAAEKEYSRLIGKCPVLTREEEYAAWKRGDTDLLVQSQLPWVMRIAITLCHQKRFRDADLAISAANVALLRSVKKFDGDLGFRLTTFVHRVVFWDVCKEIERAIEGIGPSMHIRKHSSLRTCLIGDNDERIVDDAEFVEDLFVAQESKAAIHSAVKAAVRNLPRLYRVVVRSRLEGKKFAEIAESEGVTKQAVQQRYKSAMKMLKENLSRVYAA